MTLTIYTPHPLLAPTDCGTINGCATLTRIA